MNFASGSVTNSFLYGGSVMIVPTTKAELLEMLAHGGDVEKTLDDSIRPVFEKYVRREAEHRIKTWRKK